MLSESYYIAFFGFLSLFALAWAFVWGKYKLALRYNQDMCKYVQIIDDNILISSSDVHGNITKISDALSRHSGFNMTDIIGQNHRVFRHPETPVEIFQKMWDTISSGSKFTTEIKNRKKDGSFYWCEITIVPLVQENGTIEGYNAICQDITDKKRAQHLAITDPLTQVYNRLHLDNIFQAETKRAKRYGIPYSVILLDVDYFKAINDKYGHIGGDEVLVKLVKVLQKDIRETDVLGRWGGEEFLIVLPQTALNEAQKAAEKLKEKIESSSFFIGESITCSFGVSEFLEGDKDCDSLIKRADDALYRAKELGRNRIEVQKSDSVA